MQRQGTRTNTVGDEGTSKGALNAGAVGEVDVVASLGLVELDHFSLVLNTVACRQMRTTSGQNSAMYYCGKTVVPHKVGSLWGG